MLLVGVILCVLRPARGFSFPAMDRSEFVHASAAVIAGSLSGGMISSAPALAADPVGDKLVNISDEKLKEIIRHDIVENQYLCNGQLTRSVYDEG